MSTQYAALDISRYMIISKIGKGGFSNVYRVKDLQTGKFYAAKVSTFMIDDDTKDNKETILLFREINLLSILNHPSILKFVGYYPLDFENDPFPTIITELSTNGSLRDIIMTQISGLAPDNWDDTKKLINIYGIASGMLYLHANNVIHRDLKPENILMDDSLHPKISDFGLSKLTDFLSISMNLQSEKGLKGTPIYMAPEILQDEQYSKSGDVYSFAFIVFEIVTSNEPFKNIKKISQLITSVLKDGYRPEISDDVPFAYKNLIERCWSQKAEERPTFEEICEELKNNKDFITETIDDVEYEDYIDYIDTYQSTFNFSHRVINFDDFIKSRVRNRVIKTEEESSPHQEILKPDNPIPDQKISNINGTQINENHETNETLNANSKQIKDKSTTTSGKIIEEEETLNVNESDETKSHTMIYPLGLFNLLHNKNQELIEEAKDNPEKQFEVGRFLIEGKNGFPENIDMGLSYIEQSVNGDYLDAIIYYIRILIKGKIIKQDFLKAKELLSKIDQLNKETCLLLKGLISRKMDKFKQAFKCFAEGSAIGYKECMYQFGKMHFLGEGTKPNFKEALEYINLSKDKGYTKSEYFLRAYKTLSKIKGFLRLSAEAQNIFITNNVKNLINNKNKSGQSESDFCQIILQPRKMEKLFFDKSLKSTDFLNCLSKYQNISMEINYSQSSSFEAIKELVLKIQDKKIKYMKIGIIFSILPQSDLYSCINNDISYYKIDELISNIPSESFKEFSFMKKIIIASSITSIGDNAFEGCSSLTQISFPCSVTSIGNNAFSRCSSLTLITIPSSVTLIGDFAFSECSSLTLIAIPSSVSSIGNHAFFKCSSLTQIMIPSSVTTIGYHAFHGCSSLTHIEIPSSITSIKDYTFFECSSLTQITIPSSVTSIGNYAFYECSSLTKLVFPNTLITIGIYAFEGCSSLTQIIIPSSVTSIGDYAFFKCSLLMQITIDSFETSIGKCAFDNCSLFAQIIFPSSSTSTGNYSLKDRFSLAQNSNSSLPFAISKKQINDKFLFNEHLKLSSKVTSIEKYAFAKFALLKNITIPPSVKSIGDHAFEECSSLTHISIPSSVNSIGKFAFCKCSSLVQITIPLSVTVIENSSFSECSSLTQITIPSSVTSIGDYSFFECTSLTQISIPSSANSIGKYTFCKCSSLEQITIPSSVTVIENSSFRECSSLTQITIPSSVTSIGNSAFSGCSSLTQITIPSSVTSIGSFAFSECSSLAQILISSIASIGDYSFYECSSLTQITIPSSVTSIGESTFEGCLSLEQITIPSSLDISNSGIDKKVKLIYVQ